MSVTTNEALAPTKAASLTTAGVRKLQHTRIRSVIRASGCCHKPPPPRVMR
jgi:hypothetical protein